MVPRGSGICNTAFPAENADILRGHSDMVNQVAFSQNGRWLSASSLDGSALLWDMNSANLPANPLILRKSDMPHPGARIQSIRALVGYGWGRQRDLAVGSKRGKPVCRSSRIARQSTTP